MKALRRHQDGNHVLADEGLRARLRSANSSSDLYERCSTARPAGTEAARAQGPDARSHERYHVQRSSTDYRQRPVRVRQVGRPARSRGPRLLLHRQHSSRAAEVGGAGGSFRRGSTAELLAVGVDARNRPRTSKRCRDWSTTYESKAYAPTFSFCMRAMKFCCSATANRDAGTRWPTTAPNCARRSRPSENFSRRSMMRPT